MDKIDANACYGALGMYTSLIYNVNVASSITSQGRALISSATMLFEGFLANNVKFSSINEALQFIDNIILERNDRRFIDEFILDSNVSLEDCFAKVILNCGWNWIPTFDEMEIIWNVLSNLDRYDLNRIYYKNNLYEFVSNKHIVELIKTMLHKLDSPVLNSVSIPEEIHEEIKYFSDLLFEYVYYKYMIIDRINRCDNMIKSVVMISDTDSTIISLDAWYRYVANLIDGEELKIANICKVPFEITPEWRQSLHFLPKRYDYDFVSEEIIENGFIDDVEESTAARNVRYSIINILAFVLDRLINDYMIEFCKNNNSIKDPNIEGSIAPERPCKIIMKNEFLFKRLLTTANKKNYASIVELQEGNIIPKDKQLDVKGIDVFTKSTKTEATRDALKKILLEDILKSEKIDQLRVIKDIIIFEKRIVESIQNGSKEFFKPATIKSIENYEDPMRNQGIKGAVAWNAIRQGTSIEGINLSERNGIDIIKVNIDRLSAENIKDSYPNIYQNIINLFDEDDNTPNAIEEIINDKGKKVKKDNRTFKGAITAISIPKDTPVPDWLKEFIDYNSIIEDNDKGFPYESIGIKKLDKSHVSYSNIISL